MNQTLASKRRGFLFVKLFPIIFYIAIQALHLLLANRSIPVFKSGREAYGKHHWVIGHWARLSPFFILASFAAIRYFMKHPSKGRENYSTIPKPNQLQ